MNWFAQSSQGGFWAALKNGNYERLNIKMTNEQGGPQISTVPLVAAGKHKFGMFTADAILNARAQGIPLVAVYGTFDISPLGLMFHQSHAVKDFRDLNGRRVFVAPAATWWTYLVKHYGLDQVDLRAYNGNLSTFLADEEAVFQCFVTTEPITASKQGAHVGFLPIANSGFNPYSNIMFTTEQVLRDQTDLVQAYVTASVQGWVEFIQKPGDYLPFLKSFNPDYDVDLGMETAAAEKGLFTGTSYDQSKLGIMTEERWKTLHDQMREAGVLTSDVDFRAAFAPRFVENAHRMV